MRHTSLRSQWLLVFCAVLTASVSTNSQAQLTTTEEERLQFLTSPESVKKQSEKDKTRPPLEFFRSQVAPFDVLPYVKANHWSTFSLDLVANETDYEGLLQTAPLPLRNMPRAVVFSREARLVKGQRATLGFQALCSVVPKEIALDLTQPGAIRPDGGWQASLMQLPPHQMLVMVLSSDSSNRFANWSRLAATVPTNIVIGDMQALDQRRYYRMVLPSDPEKVYLSPHPLAWSTLSHLIWDGLAPDALSVSQQQAMLDWIHWGGQLIVCAGPGSTASLFQESFLAPYLPADRSGETTTLNDDDLKTLARSYPPPTFDPFPESPRDPDAEPIPVSPVQLRELYELRGRRYRKPAAIPALSKNPMYVSVLRARHGASTISVGKGRSRVIAVESRVGRGRVTMLAFNPNEPALVNWRGMDSLIRRLVLRRPEEPGTPNLDVGDRPIGTQPESSPLSGSQLSWYRIASRDGLGAEVPQEVIQNSFGERYTSGNGVAGWYDDAFFPRLSRNLLEQASGIRIPSARFVANVILAYLLTLVPLNWFFCKFVLRRREFSWIVIPVLSLIFAVVVERVAAFDIGLDTGCDEIDLIEIQGGHDRAHLTRFSALYSTGRGQFSIAFPNDPTALALPLDTGRSIAGEDISTSIWKSFPAPTLAEFSVQPRSLGMTRSEQIVRLGGGITLERVDGKRRINNQTSLDLRGVTLIEFGKEAEPVARSLGALSPGVSIDIDPSVTPDVPAGVESYQGPDPAEFLESLKISREAGPENDGEIRMVAWIPRPMPGMTIAPEVDRHRGFTAVVAHLGYNPCPDPADPYYYNQSDPAPPTFVEPPEPPPAPPMKLKFDPSKIRKKR